MYSSNNYNNNRREARSDARTATVAEARWARARGCELRTGLAEVMQRNHVFGGEIREGEIREACDCGERPEEKPVRVWGKAQGTYTFIAFSIRT